jgi:hypothetical protein
MTKLACFVLFLPAIAYAEFGRLPLQFEANRGQGPESAQFLSRGHGYGLALSASEATFVLDGVPVRMRIVGANSSAPGRGEDLLPGTSSYFLGNDPRQWRTGIETYRRVRFREVYPGIDLVYYGNDGDLEYDFVVKPGADPSRIALEFDGVRNVSIGGEGDLVLDAEKGEVRHRRPVIFQRKNGRRVEVEGGYRLLAGNRVAFRIAAYDRTRELVIDPRLLFATHFGGRLREEATSVAVDRNGNVYVAGFATSPDFPASPGAYQSQPIGSGNDIFVVKLNPTGTTVLYATLIGGSDEELSAHIAVDNGGNAYVAGTTRSTNFPVTVSAFRTQPAGGTDGFVVKLNATGTALVYATRIGGSANDNLNGIAVDFNGQAHVTGDTQSSNFPVTQDVYRNEMLGFVDVFVTKLNVAGSGLVWSTFLGGDQDSPIV